MSTVSPVSVREIADLRQGTGAHQGYVIYSKGADQEVVKFGGMVTTTMKDGKPNTAMKGKYSIVSAAGALAGIKGEGTYSGYFTAEDKFHLDWEGNRSGAKEASADLRSDFVKKDRAGVFPCGPSAIILQSLSFTQLLD